MTWLQAAPTHSPEAVTGPMVFTDLNGRVDEFGGFDGQLYQLTRWQWKGSDWRQLHPAMVPSARPTAAVGVNHFTKKIVRFGGLESVNPYNTWTYDGMTWLPESPAIQPPLIFSGSSVFDSTLNRVILFGGASAGGDQNSTWSWTGSNWEILFPTPSPSARDGAGIAYDEALGHSIIFGGQCGNAQMSDTWELTP